MQININSIDILKKIYKSLDYDAHSLTISLPMDKFADKSNITQEFLNLCLGYLNDKELIKCSPIFTKDSNKDITITAKGIDLVEGKI